MSDYVLTEEQRSVTISALLAYKSETEHYLMGTTFTPCAPECEHCRPKAKHFTQVADGLRERKRLIISALNALDVTQWIKDRE